MLHAEGIVIVLKLKPLRIASQTRQKPTNAAKPRKMEDAIETNLELIPTWLATRPVDSLA
jgi:hypothetical protein